MKFDACFSRVCCLQNIGVQLVHFQKVVYLILPFNVPIEKVASLHLHVFVAIFSALDVKLRKNFMILPMRSQSYPRKKKKHVKHKAPKTRVLANTLFPMVYSSLPTTIPISW